MAAFAALALAVAAQGEIWEGLSPQEFWAGRKRHPAVVHSVTAVKDGSIVSLAGEWQILMREHHVGYPHYMGAKDARFEKEGRKIQVPGPWEAQGIGEKTDPKPHLSIDYSPKPLRNVHLGHGHYRRTVGIPEEPPDYAIRLQRSDLSRPWGIVTGFADNLAPSGRRFPVANDDLVSVQRIRITAGTPVRISFKATAWR